MIKNVLYKLIYKIGIPLLFVAPLTLGSWFWQYWIETFWRCFNKNNNFSGQLDCEKNNFKECSLYIRMSQFTPPPPPLVASLFPWWSYTESTIPGGASTKVPAFLINKYSRDKSYKDNSSIFFLCRNSIPFLWSHSPPGDYDLNRIYAI